MTQKINFFAIILPLTIILISCSPTKTVVSLSLTATHTATLAPSSTATPSPTFTPTLSATPTETVTLPPSPIVTLTPTQDLSAFQLSSNNEALVTKCLNQTVAILADAEWVFYQGNGWLETQPIAKTFSEEMLCWLNEGGTPEDLETILNQLAELVGGSHFITFDQLELTGDGNPEIIAYSLSANLPLFVFHNTGQNTPKFDGYLLPEKIFPEFNLAHYDQQPPLQFTDITGDGIPEILIQDVTIAPATWIRLTFYQWQDDTFRLIFAGDVVDWASYSKWELAPDPVNENRQQIVLTYPWIYSYGYDHKLNNHPEAEQVWKWDQDLKQFVFAQETVNLDKVNDRNNNNELSTYDRLQWLVNEGETAFRAGDYKQALEWYNQVLETAKTEDWKAEYPPDWQAYAVFRRAQTLLLLGQPDQNPPTGYSPDGLTAMQYVANIWQDDLLGRLAQAFLHGYDNGTNKDTVINGLNEMYQVDLSDMQGKPKSVTLSLPIVSTGLFHFETLLAAYLNTYVESDDLSGLETNLPFTDLSLQEVKLADEGNICFISTKKGTFKIPLFWLFSNTNTDWKPVLPTNVREWPQVGISTPYYQEILCKDPNRSE